MTANELPRAARLWKNLSEEHRLAAAQAFWADEQAMAEQAEVVGIIARQIHFRPRSVIAMSVEKKVRLLVRMGSVSDAVAARLLVSYHLETQRSMMGAFLDALGIAHDNGLIADEKLEAPSADRLSTAAAALREAHPEDNVTLYFNTLLIQDPETWGGLREVLAQPSTAS
jgi:hypothetical protein